jgi:predicted nuclease of predicted toxin-antitoxin system
VQLGRADDSAVWVYAKAHRLAIVSKDSDFAERSVLESGPPKIIWIRLGNCSTAEIEKLLRSAQDTVRIFLERDEETCLVLGRSSPKSASAPTGATSSSHEEHP